MQQVRERTNDGKKERFQSCDVFSQNNSAAGKVAFPMKQLEGAAGEIKDKTDFIFHKRFRNHPELKTIKAKSGKLILTSDFSS